MDLSLTFQVGGLAALQVTSRIANYICSTILWTKKFIKSIA